MTPCTTESAVHMKLPYDRLKRAIDLALALGGLVDPSPVFAAVAAAVRGPGSGARCYFGRIGQVEVTRSSRL